MNFPIHQSLSFGSHPMQDSSWRVPWTISWSYGTMRRANVSNNMKASCYIDICPSCLHCCVWLHVCCQGKLDRGTSASWMYRWSDLQSDCCRCRLSGLYGHQLDCFCVVFHVLYHGDIVLAGCVCRTLMMPISLKGSSLREFLQSVRVRFRRLWLQGAGMGTCAWFSPW